MYIYLYTEKEVCVSIYSSVYESMYICVYVFVPIFMYVCVFIQEKPLKITYIFVIIFILTHPIFV